MLQKPFFALALVFLVSPFVLASQLNVLSPVEQTIVASDEVLDLGVIGPGQTVELITSRASGELAKNVETPGEALWDQLLVVRESLPAGWSADDSKLFEKPFHAFVTASPTASDGEYSFQLKTTDQYEGAEEKVFNAKVRISKDLLEQEVSPSMETVGVGLPAVFLVRLRNRSSASDVFELSASGVPGGWKETRKVFVKFNDSVSVPYEILPGEQGKFGISLLSTSLSSSLINDKDDVTLVSVSSLEQDFKALKNGLLLFPTVDQVVYSALAVISHLLYR
ncbi:MAG: hypothetical protein V1717_01310 [Candidatus Micrarchaeota archaeon]